MYEESLKQYVNEDIVYKRYKSGETGFNDFEKFCIKHCKDIESLLEENRILNIFKENQVTPINSEEVILDLFRKKF